MAKLLSRPSTESAPPHYTPQEAELARLDSSSSSIFSAPPPYDDAPPSASSFNPSVHFQIESQGKPWLSLPTPPRPEPIPVFALQPGESSFAAASQTTPEYISIRPERCSGSSYLTTAPNSQDTDAIPAVVTTTYRFGPNRPPIVRLFSPHAGPLSRAALHTLLFSKGQSCTTPKHNNSPQSGGGEDGPEPWDTFPLHTLGLLTRAITFRTRLGTFEWRYASRSERRAFAKSPFLTTITNNNNNNGEKKQSQEISSLLILDRVVRVAAAYPDTNARNPSSTPSPGLGPSSTTNAGSGAGKKKGESTTLRRHPVAYLLRGPSFRTPGSSASSAGNGGRLVIDTALWERERERDYAGEEEVDTSGVVDGFGDGVSNGAGTGTGTGAGNGPGNGAGTRADNKAAGGSATGHGYLGGAESKVDREMIVVMALATCLAMLKREVDRRRAQQIAIMAGAAGSG